MNRRRLVTMAGMVSMVALLVANLPTNRVSANHCHPEHSGTAARQQTQATPPRQSSTLNTNRQHTRTRVPNSYAKPVSPGGSGSQIASSGSQALSFEQVYSREFPMAIISIGEAIKAIKSGDRQTELAELTKSLSRLIDVYEAFDAQIKPQFANSLRCPIMGSAINVNEIDGTLTRDYRDRKVAFCCAGCPSAWDKLSDSQKQAAVPGVN